MLWYGKMLGLMWKQEKKYENCYPKKGLQLYKQKKFTGVSTIMITIKS